MKTARMISPKVTINPNLKSNPTDPFILKKIEKATALLSGLKKTIQF